MTLILDYRKVSALKKTDATPTSSHSFILVIAVVLGNCRNVDYDRDYDANDPILKQPWHLVVTGQLRADGGDVEDADEDACP